MSSTTGAPAALDAIELIARADETRRLAHALRARKRVVATGAVGSSTALVAAAVADHLKSPVVLVVAHLDDADEAEAELASASRPVLALPAMEAAPGESGANTELLGRRVAAVRAAAQTPPDARTVFVCPIAALMQHVPAPGLLDSLSRRVARGDTLDPQQLIDWLAAAGYARTDAIEEPGEFAVRGGIIDIFPAGGAAITITDAGERRDDPAPVRLDFFGDELDKLAEIDLDTMGSDRALDAVELIAASADAALESSGAAGRKPAASTTSFLDVIPPSASVILAETLEVIEQGRGYFERVTDGTTAIDGPPAVIKKLQDRFHAFAELNQFSAGAADADVRIDLPIESLPAFERDAPTAVLELAGAAEHNRVIVACQNAGEHARFNELAEAAAAQNPAAAGLIATSRYVHRGFAWRGDTPFMLVPYHELLHRFEARRRTGRVRAGRAMDTFLDLTPGDYVVHQDHGIARFAGLEVLPAGEAKKRKPALPSAAKKRKTDPTDNVEEYLTLEFAGRSRLHVPASQIDLVQKYVGGFKGKPPLSTIGGTKWKNTKAKVAESVRDLASEMLRVRAAREHLPGIQYPHDTDWQKEFEAEFPYQETEDQLAALSELKKDMISPRPMDRLICGDVGFGKTEVAIRAAFKACEYGKQVAVLVPTTVLAEQHERTFRARFADYPFKVESLSRFKSTKEVNQTLAKLRRGEIDLVIGTHRLLSKDVKFADLGLVVIDEEQRFGVEHKETLLRLRTQVDVLTLSATPIPRTLHMSMLGLRDISSLTTAPLDRRAIVTEVIPYNDRRIKQAIERELAREGQVYFVHNRVHNIQSKAADIQSLVPDAKIVVGHGQMEPKELEKVMLTFMRGEADILVATTIIESGIDIPTANTMFINDADRFGLAELHQLRGRVGRYKHRAYCYLLLPPDRTIKEIAQRRLKAIEQYSMLGAGFKIAMRDLEIRGAGNLLGAEQSGHIATVGYEMYCRLLETAVKDLTRAPDEQPASHTTVDIGVTGIIPKAYIPSDVRRLEAYRRIATAASDTEIDRVRADLTAAYGDPPKAVERLLDLARLRAAVAALGVSTMTIRGPDVVFLAADPAPVERALAQSRATVRSISAELAQTNARSLKGIPLAEVYARFPANYLEDRLSLLSILTRRLSDAPLEPTPASSR